MSQIVTSIISSQMTEPKNRTGFLIAPERLKVSEIYIFKEFTAFDINVLIKKPLIML